MFKRALCLLVLCSAPAFAADQPASDASIRELLTVTDSRKTVDGMMAQVNAIMQNAVRESLHGQAISAADQKIIDRSVAEIQSAMSDVLSWAKLEPIYVRIYQRSLTQDEVDGMIAFYKTPVGLAVIHKVPVILQNTMTEVQTMMAPFGQKVQQAQQKLIADLAREHKKNPAR
ncbi:MAG: DUF2059 domain-containing protein [Chthoniobacterales bacterium]